MSEGKVHMKHPQEVEKKMEAMKKAGASSVQVITDFDYTMSKFFFEGKKGSSSHGAIEACNLLGDEYHQKVIEVKDKYYPLEISSELTQEEKFPLMVEWWDTAHFLLKQHGFEQSMIAKAVERAHLSLRDGVQEMFHVTADHGVPVLIFSAGIHDLIEEVLKQKADTSANVHILSNKMVFSDSGKLEGFEHDNIHVLNKNFKGAVDSGALPAAFAAASKGRHNVVLFGDSLGDLRMCEGLHMENCLSVGFLNPNQEGNLEKYLEGYDIVLTGRDDFHYCLDILKAILEQGS